MTRRVGLACALLSLLVAAGCASLPPLPERTPSHAVEPSPTTPLGRALTPLVRQHPGQTGVLAVGNGRLAFALRMLLAKAAAQSIDIQTYIWHEDTTGTLMFEEALAAAERGVRVRILLDDSRTRGMDGLLALLASRPNVEVRLYNPFAARDWRLMNLLSDFDRLNRRMHNKSFTVDNRVAIVGGRNIADEYFWAGPDSGLVDLDVLVVGDVVAQVSGQFDLYWNSASAYPAGPLLQGVPPDSREALARKAESLRSSPAADTYMQALAGTQEVQHLLDGDLDLEWTSARAVHDDPAKTLAPGTQDEEPDPLPKIEAVLGRPTASLDLISPYFVPGELGTETLGALVRRGVRVRVLTNSLAATDVVSVHAGYSKRRDALLRSGVRLYELKPDAGVVGLGAHDPAGTSNAALHAKTYAVDGRTVFVGSFNLDPRSSQLNTEMGVVIDSPALATRLSTFVAEAWPRVAYRVTLDADGDLRWDDSAGAVHTTEPGSTWWRRLVVRITSWLNVEWLM
jgi:putative cardiolipin synthase